MSTGSHKEYLVNIQSKDLLNHLLPGAKAIKITDDSRESQENRIPQEESNGSADQQKPAYNL